MIHNYLSNRKQIVKINSKYSSWREIFFGVSQGSILGLSLFDIFICDRFYFLEDFDIVSNYRAMATIYNDYTKLEDQSVLLGITIDSRVIFDKHISSIFEKASQKLNTRARIAAHMSIQKRRTIMKSFLTSQFGHCLLTWMFHNC